jgi:hypothetical protein
VVEVAAPVRRRWPWRVAEVTATVRQRWPRSARGGRGGWSRWPRLVAGAASGCRRWPRRPTDGGDGRDGRRVEEMVGDDRG